MKVMGDELTLVFEIVEEDAAPEELERTVRGLRRDLIEIDSVSTEQVSGPDQPGAKGDIGLFGTIAVSMVSAAVPAVITLLGRWMLDRRRCVLGVSKVSLMGGLETYCGFDYLVGYVG